MAKIMRVLTLFALSLMISIQGSFAYAFEYGQCLLGRAESFNNELREYRNVALAKAAIKKLALEQNSDLLKWNYGTTRLIYDLVVLRVDLIRLNNIYRIIRAESPNSIAQIQTFFDGESGHVALAQVDDDKVTEREKSVSDLIDFLEKLTDGDVDAQTEISALRKSVETEWFRDALGDLYDRIQEASVGATPVEPDSIEQWISLAQFFSGRMAPADCAKCVQAESVFSKVTSEWTRSHFFPDEGEDFKDLASQLPPLLKIKFPSIPETSKEALKVIGYQYLRTMEDFLFSRAGITQEYVDAWMKKDPNYKIILNQADRDVAVRSESKPNVKIYKYIQSKVRVLGNAFDHFVWEGQQGTELEKSIDGVARTLYGEAESCQISGAHQFEAIGAIIAARSVSVDQENRDNNIFVSVVNFGIGIFNVLSPLEIAPLSSYKSGASDFGRTHEMSSNPVVAEMATPAQVVSRPGQFSVWKIGNVESLEVSRWIRFPTNLGYPSKMKTTVSGPLGKDVDPAQRKVLCPNNDIFKKAVDVAKELVTDYNSYANKYRFHQSGNRVVPYFYTHGANVNLSFVRQIIPKPSLYNISGHGESLPIYEGSNACKTFKLYQPKYFKVSSQAGGQRKKSSRRH